jgi:hypothetical protein
MQNADGLLWFLTLEARLSERDKLFISDTWSWNLLDIFIP